MTRDTYSESDRQTTIQDLNTYADTLRDASSLFEEKVDELSLLRRIGNIVGYLFDKEVFYHKLIDILLEETPAENCSFMLIDADTDKLIIKMARGRNDHGTFFEHPQDSETLFSLGEGIAGKVALGKEIILINEVSEDRRFKIRETRFPINSLLCAPLVFKDKAIGVINLSSSRAHAFKESHKRVLQLLCTFVSSIIAHAAASIKARDQEKFEAMFEGVKFPILLLDPKTMKITECNNYTEEWLGYGREELLRKENVFEAVPPEHRDRALHIVREISTKHNLGFYELPFIKKEGSIALTEINGTLISYQERKAIQLTIRDITKRKEMEHKLIQSEKLKSLGELAGGVAHDFNNVLAAILGRAQLLKLHIDTPRGTTERRKSVSDLKKSLEVIEKAALDGAETVRRIQDFAQMRGNDDYLSLININEAIDYAIEFTKVRWKNEAEAQGVTYHIKKELSSLPPLKGSATELREVVTNLINNALDAMPQGGQITIKTFKDNHHLAVTISDTGSGIPTSIQDRIFDPFFTTKGVQATGLGLSVSYGIITRHRGMISVESVEGGGATFTIQFPLTEHTRDKKHHHKNVTPPSPERQKVRILIIEDEKEVREVLHDILSHAGYEVETAPQGNEGVELFKQKHFDAVFTDLGMPGMSGWQVAEEIKKINNKTFVVLVTGWEVNPQSNELKKNEVDLVVHKPFQIDQLLQLVQKTLHARRD